MFVLPAFTGVTVTFTPVEFSGMVTRVGMEMMFGSNPLRVTITPPASAGVVRPTNNVPGALLKFRGFGVRIIFLVAAVMVTVLGSLLPNPSLTINCTT